MSKKNKIIGSLIGLGLIIGGASIFLITQNKSNKSEETLKIGINSGESDFYNFAKKELKNEGVDLKIQVFDDYVQPNLALASQTLDINAFQHVPYLNKFKEEHKDNSGVQQIVPLAKTLVSPLRLYTTKYKSLDELLKQKQIKIAIPNDPTNEARALQLLKSKKLIDLKKSDLTVTIKDVIKTNYNIELKELDAAQTPKVLNEMDASVINGNYAQVNNVSLNSAIITEDESVYHKFDNVIAGKEEIKKKGAFKKFLNFIKSQKALDKRKELNKFDIFIKEN